MDIFCLFTSFIISPIFYCVVVYKDFCLDEPQGRAGIELTRAILLVDLANHYTTCNFIRIMTRNMIKKALKGSIKI